jgi:hypothetical protein
VIYTDLTTLGFSEIYTNHHHPDNNTRIEQLDKYWEPPYYSVYASQHNMSIFTSDIHEKINNTLNNGFKVYILGSSEFDSIFSRYCDYGYFDGLNLKSIHNYLLEISNQ